MATVWHHYGYPLPNTCETATNRVPNIKGKSGARRSGLKKVKNEHRFIGLRTYVHWPTNRCSSAHEHMFIFSRVAVGIVDRSSGRQMEIRESRAVLMQINSCSIIWKFMWT